MTAGSAQCGPGGQTGAVPALSDDDQRARVAAARVARFASLRADGTPRLVPVTLALVDGTICSAVDEIKPKRSTRLARLDDIARDPRAAVIVDHYDDDWAQLWWVRIDGTADVHDSGDLHARALAALTAKYPPYAAAPPTGAVIVLTPTRWAGWTAAG